MSHSIDLLLLIDMSVSNVWRDIVIFFYSLPFLSLILFFSIVNKGNSHNMMKSSANRRRGKQEIIDAKLAEQQRLRDIEVKMLEHSQMQA
jgi:hypothetical protein